MNTEASTRRVRWGYEPETPRCCTCRNYRKAHMPAPNKIEPPRCVPGRFNVMPNGCCDKWIDRSSGERLAS